MSYQELYRGLTKTASYEEIATLATMLKQAALIKEEKKRPSGRHIKNVLQQVSHYAQDGKLGKGPEVSKFVEFIQGNLRKGRPAYQNVSIKYPPVLAGKMPLVAGKNTFEKAYNNGQFARKLLTEGKLVPGNLPPDKGQSVFSLRNAQAAGEKAGLPKRFFRAGELGPRIHGKRKPTVLPEGTGASFGGVGNNIPPSMDTVDGAFEAANAPKRDYSKALKALGYSAGGATLGSAGNYLLNTRPLKAENKELRNQLGTGFWDRIWKALQALFNGTSKNYVGAA